MILNLLLISLIITLFIYVYLKYKFSYWKRKNIPYKTPSLIFGNLKDSALLKKSLGQEYTDIYREFPNFPYIGFYKVRKPAIILRDAEIIHNIFTKDFNHFTDNAWQIDESIDPYFARDPFFIKGQKWKSSRSLLNGSFTPSRLKLMFNLILKVSEDMINYIEEKMQTQGNAIETKELVGKFTTDNITSCIMGLEGKSFEDENAVFRKLQKLWTTPSKINAIKVFITIIFPSLISVLKIKLIPKKIDDYFEELVPEILKLRTENGNNRKDFIGYLKEIMEKDGNYTLEDLIGHVCSFFVEGSETSTVCLSFALYELSNNIDVQTKARDEIKQVLSKNDGKFSFNGINEMAYLEMVIYETLRLYPPGFMLEKLCTEPYYLPPINGNLTPLKIEKGTAVGIPLYGIQTDPKYFENPDKFHPERFSIENKPKIVKGSYLPFGEGPRACIGQRLAMTQIKVGLASLLNRFDLRLNPKTRSPLEIDKRQFMMSAKGDILIDYYKRN